MFMMIFLIETFVGLPQMLEIDDDNQFLSGDSTWNSPN